MKRLTVAGRLLITALILAALYFGFTYFGGQKMLESVADKAKTEETTDSEYKVPEPEATNTSGPAAEDTLRE